MTATEVQEHLKQAHELRKRAEALVVASREKPLTEEQDKEIDSLLEKAEAADKMHERAKRLLAAERAKAEEVETEKDKPAEERDKPLSESDLKRRAFFHHIHTGERTLQLREQTASVDAEGGFVVAPMVVLSEVLKEVDDARPIRGLARVLPPTPPNGSLGLPFSNNTTLNAAWSSELTTAAPSNLSFSGREFKPTYLTSKIFFSWALLDSDVINVESYARGEMATITGEMMERAYMTGNGVAQPLGLFTESDDGVPASRNIAATANAVSYDNIIDMFYGLKSQYMANATWFMHRTVLQRIAKIKNNENTPIWRTGLAPGDPSMIEGRPIVLSEFAPAFAGGTNVMVVGDLSKYWICDSTMMRVTRQTETYADQNLVAVIVRQQTDGAPVLAEAFRRLKTA